MEIFELQAREIMDCWVVRSGYPFGKKGIIEESCPTKINALFLMKQLLQTEIQNELKRGINNLHFFSDGPNDTSYNPGGTD